MDATPHPLLPDLPRRAGGRSRPWRDDREMLARQGRQFIGSAKNIHLHQCASMALAKIPRVHYSSRCNGLA